jgi:myosin-1
LTGSGEDTLRRLGLSRDPQAYHYVRQGGAARVDAINDKTEHKTTTAAFTTLGFDAGEKDVVWQVAAAVLQLVSS